MNAYKQGPHSGLRLDVGLRSSVTTSFRSRRARITRASLHNRRPNKDSSGRTWAGVPASSGSDCGCAHVDPQVAPSGPTTVSTTPFRAR
eukprot:scaffold582_cov385-Prasinococcus_capsulatus_cf.AAC.52